MHYKTHTKNGKSDLSHLCLNKSNALTHANRLVGSHPKLTLIRPKITIYYIILYYLKLKNRDDLIRLDFLAQDLIKVILFIILPPHACI